MADQIGKIIGRRKYDALKSFNLENVSDEELEAFNTQFPNHSVAEGIKMIKSYEEKYNHASGNSVKLVTEYFERINKPKPPKEKKILTKEILWELFTKKFREQNKVEYSKSDESIENLKPLIYYFIGDYENFKNCKNLSNISIPSFSKGLLLIGPYGNGKSSTMKALQSSLAYSNVSFMTISTNDAVEQFEGLKNQEQKDDFWKEVTNRTYNFDDLLTEREASNFGKVNLFKDILEKRYEKNKRTHGSCNFDDKFPNDIEKALDQYAVKYGSRVYDRLFSMFNIIEFKGKSFRK